MRIRDLFRRRKAATLLTTEIVAREYARLCCARWLDPTTGIGYDNDLNEHWDKLNEHYRQGRILFANMSRFDDDARRQSLEAFTDQFIAPLVRKTNGGD